MSTTRFDPKPDALYARCRDCRAEFSNDDEVSKHTSETCPPQEQGGRSHTVSILNPDRHLRIQGHVASVVSDAVSQACDDLISLVEKGDLTAEEVSDALTFYPDFDDVWVDYRADWEAEQREVVAR